ncbi:hypothetical protein DPMN_052501 [Dreissena polymorpha]|uniref:Uncharacterized protein n=1 Tax=Dreissena polymorpha TaxID=45954 RepID=A0A9D4CJT4_DREPO|nr:hypothetical protein DPMN_052501 [Dreissena polymorpha]
MSRLHCGFLFHPDGSLDKMSWCDLEFHHLGDDGTPVTDFTIRFKAGRSFIIMRLCEKRVLFASIL